MSVTRRPLWTGVAGCRAKPNGDNNGHWPWFAFSRVRDPIFKQSTPLGSARPRGKTIRPSAGPMKGTIFSPSPWSLKHLCIGASVRCVCASVRLSVTRERGGENWAVASRRWKAASPAQPSPTSHHYCFLSLQVRFRVRGGHWLALLLAVGRISQQQQRRQRQQQTTALLEFPSG